MYTEVEEENYEYIKGWWYLNVGDENEINLIQINICW